MSVNNSAKAIKMSPYSNLCFVAFLCISTRDHLDRFVADNFPSKSSEYEVGTPRYSDYIFALNKVSV